MAFEFGGTFNRSMFDRYMKFARSQTVMTASRIAHLNAEKQRVGVPTFKFDDKGSVLGYTASPPTSYVAKLLSAYEAQGGDPYLDLAIRLKDDPLYRLRGDHSGMSQLMSNGEVIGQNGLADAESAKLMHKAKEWLYVTLDYRMGSLERKIRRALDYYDQLDDEILLLKAIMASADTEGSLEYIANEIMDLITDGTYRVIYDDKGTDPEGKNVRAGFSSFDSGPATSNEALAGYGPRRQDDGFKNAGES